MNYLPSTTGPGSTGTLAKTRPPGNRCWFCDGRVVLSVSGNWGYVRVLPEKRLIGYAHRDCPREPEAGV